MPDKLSYEQLEESVLKLENENCELNMLYKAATTISSNLSLKEVLKTVADQMSEALITTGCAISIFHEDRFEVETLIDLNRVHPDDVDKPGTLYDLNEYPATLRALETGKAVLVRVDDPAADQYEVALMKAQEVFTNLMLPLKTTKKIFGHIDVYDDLTSRNFTRREIQLAESLASQAAVALENAHLFESAQREIEKRKRTESALQESKELFDSFMKYLPALAFMKDKEGRYIYLNQAYETLYKVDPKDRIGKTDDDLFPADVANRIMENDKSVIKEGKVLHRIEKIKFNGNTYHQMTSTFPILKDGEAILLAGIALDITDQVNGEKDRARMEEKLRRSHRMEALGLLAGGVAHDLNNVLSGIVNYPELLLLDLPGNSPLRDPVLKIQKSGHRAAEIVQDFLTITRRGVVHTEVLNLNQVIAEYLQSPEHEKLLSYHPKIFIKSELGSGLLNIKGSSIHLKKSVMNLVSNAAEAQPDGGIITVSTHNRYLDDPMGGHGNFKEGDYVVFKIKDEGEGIASEDLEKIFEPFYTKKVMGRSGTGLGMSVVWGTVEDHNGYIHVESSEGDGTLFELFFPVIREEIVEEKQLIPMETYMGHRESILVVDDVQEQREIASRILHRLGYLVKTVSCGEEAVSYLKNDAVDLVILDMVMDPGIDGLETYQKIIEIHPGQKAIIASGFAETERVQKAQELGVGQCLTKPYTIENIGLAVNNELKAYD
jgi:two-component system, cell cycle sensor histidine kinase and response regulator CckA